MKLSTKARYAVAALADVALHAAHSPAPLSDVAARQDISLAYLEQLFVKLRRAALVESLRGPGGGYTLARPAHSITIADIMAAVDETVSAVNCADAIGRGCGGSREQCLTHDLWERLSAHVHVFLQQTTLADVTGRRLEPCPAVTGFAVDAPHTPQEGAS